MLAREGIAATTTRSIAREAGVNQAMLNYYFGSKDELLFAVLQALMQQTQQIVLATRSAPSTLPQMIRASISAFWAFVERAPEIQTMQLELTLYALRHSSSTWLAKQQYAGYAAVVEQLIREGCAETGETCAVPFDLLARFIMGGLDGIILQFISDRDIERARRHVALLCEAVIALAQGNELEHEGHEKSAKGHENG